jgi:N-methylhydantoinase B
MTTQTSDRLDPITFEVLRHKLDEVTAEGYHTIERVSGSPVVYESGDHQEALCTADGRLAAFGASVLHWVRSIGMGVKYVAETYAENPGFQDGDQFLVNDSYGASVHASDVQLLAPIFWEGRLIAWAGTASHQMDTGGVNPGGHHVDAREVYAEGFQTRGLKLVERGVIRADIEDTFANMVRTPDVGLLDIRAKIAANNVMKERVLGIVERYGVDVVLALFEQLIQYSEGRLRHRLAELTDGRWTASNYVEGIVEPTLGVQVAVEKRGDSLTIDFTGSSPQAQGPENMGVPGSQSCAMLSVITTLCYDIPWNEGVFQPVDFILPKGTVVNPRRPAPISATIPSGATHLVPTATELAISKMLYASEAFRSDAHGGTSSSKNFPVFAGLDRDGREFTTLILDANAGGGGALPDRDGDSSAHNPWAAKSTIANVETTEMVYPLLFLWRSETRDSAGAGEFRGGLGIREAILPWGSEELVLVTVGTGTKARNTPGLAGGYPGSNTPLRVMRGADISSDYFAKGILPRRSSDLAGEAEHISAKGMVMLGVRDVLDVVSGGGGGGFGDPLLRDPEAVADDVRRDCVSPEMAAKVYGVVLSGEPAMVDGDATAAARAEIKRGRLARQDGSVDTRDVSRCRGCGAEPAAGFAYDEALGESEPAELQPIDGMFLLRHRCCTQCGTLLDVSLVVNE